MPASLDIALALEMNGSVQITPAGTPLFSSSIPSCTLHDEQDPQSPDAVITTSHWSASSSIMSDGQGLEALPLSIGTTLSKS